MLIHTQICFDTPLNVSIQQGDIVYYNENIINSNGFQTADISNMVHFGPIVGFGEEGMCIIVEHDDILNPAPSLMSYIAFVKDKRVNTSSLLGYYMDIKFVNDSYEDVELFSVGSEIVESSK